MMNKKIKYGIGFALIMVAISLVSINILSSDGDAPVFTTDFVRKGDIESVVLTNSVLYPSQLVNVGSQAVGQIEKLAINLGDLIARIKAVLRRTMEAHENDHSQSIKQAEFEMKVAEHEVTFKGKFLDLTPREFLILQLFLEHNGRVFSRNEILMHAYQDTLDISDRNIDTHIKNIRKKINEVDAKADLIHSVYDVGYKFSKQA